MKKPSPAQEMKAPGKPRNSQLAARKNQGSALEAQRELVLRLRGLVEASQPGMLGRLSELVHIESPSNDKAAVDRAVTRVAGWCEAMHGRVRIHRQREFGDLLEVRFSPPAANRKAPLLLLGHLDTVWENGTLERMPWRQKAGRIYGPGILDMKAGVVMALTAVEALLEAQALARPIVLLLHSDEEIGSNCSRALTERVARGCEAVYVLEPAQGDAGAYKTARKGVGYYRLDVTGVAAHSGVDFGNGHSAILELAHQIERIREFTDIERGITVNPGVVSGGTRSNVVAAHASAEIDFRIARANDAARVERKFQRLAARDRACRLQLSGGLNRPPMERTPEIVRLFRKAQALAEILGFHLEEASTGGGSDGNFTAAIGVPTLDGMGAVGSGAHADDESILVKHLAPRTALLAAMML